ncbi:MAG: dihydroorotase [Bacteroidetes bacterium]|nr:dihydroorotase [Bacteroidota bacterium]
MKLLLKSALIIDSTSSWHMQKKDILLEKGKITEVSDALDADAATTIFEAASLCIAPSFIDLNTSVFEPGLEYREDFQSILKAAEKAGYGALCMLPNTKPIIEGKSQVEYVHSASKNSLSKLLPLGALSHHLEGKDLSEIYDMHTSGALAFTDAYHPIWNEGLMERALLYVKKFKGLVYSFPQSINLSARGQMNEGVNSTILGLEGLSNLSEDIIVARDLFLLEHTDSRLHFMSISSAKSVQMIREAKAKGLKVSASVNVANLYFTDKSLLSYDTNFKIQAPLRTEEDRIALLQGLQDGTIDAISSGHLPLHEDEKKVEFENAEFGMSTIDCVFSAAFAATKSYLSVEALVSKFTAAYKILGLESSRIKLGQEADFTIFSTDAKYVFEKSNILSKGKNNPFELEEFEARTFGLIKGSKTNIL